MSREFDHRRAGQLRLTPSSHANFDPSAYDGDMRLLILCLVTALVPSLTLAENRLAGASSLYLRQHADQPVDWYPWGKVALQKARETGKPIFVSVGYAACHWCHVMAGESFENPAIAAQLNANFISIKIDRERRPDLDEQFSLVTSALTGTSGWPNSVFLTPDGAPFYAGGYFPPDAFSDTLTAVQDAWANDRAEVLSVSTEITTLLQSYLNSTAALRHVTSDQITKAALATITDLDDFNGGFGTGLKFPRESHLLFLLDQAARHGQTDLLDAVTLTLDGMLRGGIHDQIGGGFHRYAIDPEWLIPHFEKMLYNQALMARVLIRAHHLTGNPDYTRAATRTLDYVLRDMTAPGGGFFSAQDADTRLPSGERVEGLHYTWTPDKMHAALGKDAARMIAALNIDPDGAFHGRSIASLGQSLRETAALADMTPARFDTHLATLLRARATRLAPIRDEKIILSWNAAMITALAESATYLDQPRYLSAAETAADFLLRNLTSDAGLMRISYNGHADTPAQLADYAALGGALIALHDHGSTARDWLAIAETLAATLQARFADPAHPMRMTSDPDGLGPYRPLDDTELPSGNALALDFLAALDRRRARIGDVAPLLAATLAGPAIDLPDQRSAILTALETARSGPAGPLRISSGGAVGVQTHADRPNNQVIFAIKLRPGWHLNAHRPLDAYLIGVALSSDAAPLPASAYPDPVTRTLGFSTTPLALYETDFTLTAPVDFTTPGPHRLSLTLQACDDAQCLPPDSLVFWFW